MTVKEDRIEQLRNLCKEVVHEISDACKDGSAKETDSNKIIK
jgi:hypothetical protein